MSTPNSSQEIFEKLIALQGSMVEVGNVRTGEHFRGRVAYTMFDSFILEVAGKNKIIRFSDIMYLNPSR